MDPAIPAELRVPPSVTPELRAHGDLFARRVVAVGDRVRCAIGFGLANIVLVEGTDGVIVVDTGESKDQATDVLAELRKLTPKPVAAVVLTHHHADHVLGTSVFVSAEDAASGKVPVFAHDSLVARYVDETGVTAELQAARALHMYGGSLLPADRDGSNTGIGPFLGRGETGFVAPNRTFGDALDVTIAGVRMELRAVPSEAESEIAVNLPDDRTLLAAEVVQDHTFPNVYTIRGARYRDPLAWVRSLDRLRAMNADAMVLAHGPPVTGHDEVAHVLTVYRDEIQYVHDQTVRRMNEGLPPDELALRVALPPHLANEKPWGQPFYGSVKHSVRNVYGGYEGWFQGDPVTLDPTPPVESAHRLVELMGGRDRVLAEARRALTAGDAQFAAELATYLVRLDPKAMDARRVKASAFRRLGYAQVNASWRNYYLVSAMELDDQVPEALYLHEVRKILGTAMRGLPPEAQMALWPVRLRAEETLDEDVVAAVRYPAEGKDFTLHLRRGVLEISTGLSQQAAFTVTTGHDAMGAVLAGAPFGDALDRGALSVAGDASLARRFFGWFDVPFTHKPDVVVR